MPYQIEYREGAALVMTQILLTGENPFALENQPLGMNNYGIVYNLQVLPFAKLFGNTLMVHRSVSFFFLFASLLLVARTIWAVKKDALMSIVGGLFIVILWAGRGGLGAFPSTMGAFLFLSAILIPFIYSFRYPSLIVSALLSILAFYTKPYFVIGFVVVAVYTFAFISKQKGVISGLFFLFAFGVIFLGVRYVFKMYFIDTFISNLSNASRSSEHLRSQLLELGKEFFPIILLWAALLIFSGSNFPPGNSFRKYISSRSSNLDIDAALFRVPINYFAVTFIFCFIGFVFVLGLHMGSYMTSAYQLVVPPFILWLFQTLNSKNRFSIIALCLLFGNILLLDNILLHPSFLRQMDSVAWSNLYHYVRSSHRVVNSPAVVSALIDAGISPLDSGQTEYYYNIKPYPDNVLFGPSYETVERNGITYRHAIQNAVRNQKFDTIFLTDGYGNLIPADTVSQYYMKVDTIILEMPQTDQTWVIGVWEPKGK
ncbi:MAG TPA: hypothetical protein VFR47_30045 [Anaerolineales bacterium]|nr:hypothetical protein [Anaerolineales bacterium]